MPPVHDFPDLEGDDYRLIRRLGSGGMGVVFEALQLSLNRKVAVKLLSPLLLQDAAQRIQFEHEAHVIARLHHPNIVRIFSATCRPGCCYYAMELIEGKSLDGCEFSNPYEIARIGLQAARAIAYAHRCGILHRDIKPANLLLDEAGEVHVSDFGLAFLLQERNEVIEKEGAQSGTLRYMSPERLVHGVNTFSSDQYAFGVTLYELVAKSPPFPGIAPEELMERICREPVPPLKCIEPDLAAIINKCVSFRPESRYRSMDELSEDLLHFLNHEPVGASSPSPSRRLQLWMKRKPAVAVLSLAAALCAAAFVVALAAGYLQTASALKLAENNAAVADAALSQVFTRIAEQPPSQKNTQLLSALLPYYRMIARGKNLPESKVCEANAVIGECALRTGSYALAEKAFRNMMKFRKDAFPINQLATALKNRVKIKRQRNFSGRWPTALRCRSGRRIGLKRSARCWLCPVLRRVLSVPGRSECWKHCWRMILTILNTVFNTHSFWPEIPAFSGRDAFPALNRMQPCCSSSLPTPIRNGRNTAWRW